MTSKNKTILVVDDDEDILKILQKILKGAGHNVHVALSPEEGRKILLQESPHLIISDLNMEPEDGYSFIKSIRQQKQFKQIPILVLSAINEFATVKKVVALGINDYIIKPLQAPMLLRKINKAIRNKDFYTWRPSKGEEPILSVKLEAKVIELGETGYRVAGPFKISQKHDININVEEFKNIGIDNFIQKSGNLLKTYLSGGYFSNDVTFIAINEDGSSKIRQFINKSNRE